MKKIIYLFTLILLISACQSKKKQAELLELSKPEWLKSRPVSSNYFYGIGIAPKLGGSEYYTKKAKEKALADLAQQINTRVKSETNFTKTEDNSGVYEYIQSRINATSNEFLEGYKFVDSWEDKDNTYAFYQLSKTDFYSLKTERKNKAIELAWLKIQQALEQDKNNNMTEAIQLYASAIDALSGFLDQETSKIVNDEKIDLFETSKTGIIKLIEQLNIQCSTNNIDGKAGNTIPNGTASILVSLNHIPTTNIPVKFTYSGGYIINDKVVSDVNGKVKTPLLNYNKKTTEQLDAEIDFVNLARKTSKNLLVRQLIENQKRQSCLITIRFK
nr:LPP20 family lipoprotein [uncultured Carboxylicivirga sp.]